MAEGDVLPALAAMEGGNGVSFVVLEARVGVRDALVSGIRAISECEPDAIREGGELGL